jgi:hypothetical protein
MPLFKIRLAGDNFLIRLEGDPGKFGFFTTRFVDAADEAAAATRGLSAVWDEVLGKVELLNAAGDDPRIGVERVERIEPYNRPENDPGFAWFPEDETQVDVG